MDQNLNKNFELKEKLISFFKNNKKTLIFLFILIFMFSLIFILIKKNDNKTNILLSEKYIQAGILLVEDNKNESKKLLEEIISSGNKFYSLLALNKIIEKDLINDNNKVIEYFEKLEEKKFSEEIKNLLLLKKALYIMKFKNDGSGKEILNNLNTKKSKMKSIAREIISK